MESYSQVSFLVQAEKQIFRIQPAVVEKLTQAICAGLGVGDYEISWDFITPDEMRSINLQYRSKDSSTDVLSFPQETWPEPLSFQKPIWPQATEQATSDDQAPKMLGDVLISPLDAFIQANDIGHKLDRETAFLLVHGILHLCGHDHIDAEEESRMIEQQKTIMQFLESVDSTPLWTGCCEVEA